MKNPILIVGGMKGKGRSYSDAFESDKPILILGAVGIGSVHLSVIEALTSLGKSENDILVVSTEDAIEKGVPDYMEESLKEGNQFVIIKDREKFEKDFPSFKLEIPDKLEGMKAYNPQITEDKDKHPFSTFIEPKGKRRK